MEKHQDLIDRIYEAPFQPHMWKGILQDLANIAGARGGLLSSVPTNINSFIFSDSIWPLVEATIADNLASEREMEPMLLKESRADFYIDSDVFDIETRQRTRFYTEILMRHGIGHVAGTQIRMTTGEHLLFSVLRSHDKGPVSQDALDELTTLRPHLARAVTLSIRNEFQQVQNANRALAATGLASAAINNAGGIIDCNALFSSLNRQLIISAHDRLRLAHAPANAILDESLERARRNARDSAMTSRSVALPATQDASAAILHLIPARGIVRDLFRHTAFFVIITPLGQVNPAPVDIIETLFDLTVSEARIARSLAMGHDVKDMADHFGISTETVRKHLKSIFSKTGISRQAELSATIAGLKVIQ